MIFALLKPSANIITSAISSLSGTLIATGLIVRKLLSPTVNYRGWNHDNEDTRIVVHSDLPVKQGDNLCVSLDRSADQLTLWEMALICSSKSRLNSSEHPDAPHRTSRPMKMRPIAWKSMFSLRLKKRICRPRHAPRAFTRLITEQIHNLLEQGQWAYLALHARTT